MSHTIWGSFNGASTQYIRPYIEVSWSQNISNNTSTVTARLYFHRYTNNYWSYNELTNSNGHSSTFRVGNSTLTQIRPFNLQRQNPPNRVLVWERTRTIQHNSDGTASVNISANGDTNVNPRTYSFGETVTLPTIPRQTTITSVSMRNELRPSVQNTLDVNISRKHSTYSHRFEIMSGSTVLQSTTGNVPTTITVSSDTVKKMIESMPTVMERQFTFRVTTLNSSGNVVGRATKNFTVKLNDETTKPQFGAYGASAAFIGARPTNFFKFVQSQTKAYIEFNFKDEWGKYVGDFTANVKVGTKTYNVKSITPPSGLGNPLYYVTSDVIQQSGDVNLEIYATNSRGQTGGIKTTINVLPYSPPAIQNFTVVRSSVNSTNVIVNRRYTRESLDGANTPTTGIIERKVVGGSTWTEVNDSNLLSLSATITGNNASTSYTFRTTVTDRFGNSATAEASIGTAKVLMEKYRDEGVSFGKRFETGKGTLQVGGDIYHVDDNGIPSNMTTPILIIPDLENGFGEYNWGNVGYTKIGGIVHLNGMVTVPSTAASGQRIFLLPEGYRPNMTKVFKGHSGSNAYRIDVTTAGTVRWNNNSSGITWVSINNISFPVGG